MHPRLYGLDFAESQNLATLILSATTPPQIAAAVTSTTNFLRSHSPDQSRHFFSITFPSLISKLFGFDDAASSSPKHGWIDTVLESNDPQISNQLFDLFAPNGPLLSSIKAVDRVSLVRYVFPTERLPEWTRYFLSSDKDSRVLEDLCPLFRGRISENHATSSGGGAGLNQVQLNVFEYYMFWFGYYPVCRGNSENLDRVTAKKSKRFRLESWTSSIPGLISSIKRGNEQKIECNLYVRLFYAYLSAYVPVSDLELHQPYRSSLLHYSMENDGLVLMHAMFVVNLFVQYWLVDNDFSPVSVSVCKSFDVSFPFRSVVGESPPTSGLGEVVKLFVKYLNLSAVMGTQGCASLMEYNGTPKWSASSSFDAVRSSDLLVKSSYVNSVGSWNVYIQRPLYRYILRTFLFCPLDTSIKNASQVFSVWVSYIEPWTITSDDFSELDAVVGGVNKNKLGECSSTKASGYNSCWQSHVLSNYLYYSSLVMHFIGFAHKFLHADPEVIVQMVVKILSILASSKELLDLIKKVHILFHAKEANSGRSSLSSLYQFIPSIREQLQDWEDGLCERDADGSFLHENWNKDLHLFSDDEDGGQRLLQLFILRAEAELQAISGDNLGQNLKQIDCLKAQVSQLFGSGILKTMSGPPQVQQRQQSSDGIFKPRRMGNYAAASVKYKGDWMKRPVSSDEIAWLAKLLVWLSSLLNEAIGLNHSESTDDGPKWSYVDMSRNITSVNGFKDFMKVVSYAVRSFLLMLCAAVASLMRKHGVRVNLRLFASKKIVMLLLLFGFFSILKKCLSSVC